MGHLTNLFICAGLGVLLLSLPAMPYSGGSGTSVDPYQIADVNDWQQLMNTSADWSKAFILTRDVDLANVMPRPIGDDTIAFTGTVLGNHHSIRNLNVTGDYAGLFGRTSSATIRDIAIADANISTSSPTCGSLVGTQYYGLLKNCSLEGQLTCSFSTPATTWAYVGALVGYQYYGTITNCRTAGKATLDCSASPGINAYVGGLAGYQQNATITDCTSLVSVSSSATSLTANATGSAGGLAGYQLSSTTTHCRSNGSVMSSALSPAGSPSAYAGGLVGTQFSSSVADSCSAATVTCDAECSVYSLCEAYVGGLVGYQSSGTITGCCSSGSADCSASSFSTTYAVSGGLVGYQGSSGTIVDCYSMASASSFSASHLTSYGYAGGLLGRQIGPASIRRCYSTGMPWIWTARAKYIGGLLGAGTQVTASFWDQVTSLQLQGNSDGTLPGVGADLKTQSTYTDVGWDFTRTWAICQGTNYPRLRWQIPVGDWVCPDGVNIEDMAYFSQRWLASCSSGNTWCTGADINHSGRADFSDLALFAANWMQ